LFIWNHPRKINLLKKNKMDGSLGCTNNYSRLKPNDVVVVVVDVVVVVVVFLFLKID